MQRALCSFALQFAAIQPRRLQGQASLWPGGDLTDTKKLLKLELSDGKSPEGFLWVEAYITPALTESSAAEGGEPDAAVSKDGFSELIASAPLPPDASAPLSADAAAASEVSNVPDVSNVPTCLTSPPEAQVELEIQTAAPVPARGVVVAVPGCPHGDLHIHAAFNRKAMAVTCSDLLPVSGRAIATQPQILAALQTGHDGNIAGLGNRGSGDPATDMTWMALGYHREYKTYPTEQRLRCQFCA